MRSDGKDDLKLYVDSQDAVAHSSALRANTILSDKLDIREASENLLTLDACWRG